MWTFPSLDCSLFPIGMSVKTQKTQLQTGPSSSKHRRLNEFVSGQNVNRKCKSYSHFFSKNISVCAIFNDQSFNDTLTNDIVSFEQLGPGV